MADPVVASDGKTYEREYIERWMKTHDVSPLISKPFVHKFLIPNDSIREQNGTPVPVAAERHASFHARCDNQVGGRHYKGFRAAFCNAVAAGAYAGHRALHHGALVRRLRQRAVELCWYLHQRRRVFSVPGRESAQRRAHVL
jgi:hypothetical protein